MPKVTPLQTSFAAGEISPKLRGRRQLEGYSSGVAIMENFVADPRGPALSRGGFRFVSEAVGDDAHLEYVGELTGTYCLSILTDLKISVFGLAGATPATNFVTNPRFKSGSTGWNEVTTAGGSTVLVPDAATLTTGSSGSASIDQAVTTTASGAHEIVVHSDHSILYHVQVGTAAGDGTYYDVWTRDERHEAPVTLPGTAAHVTITVAQASEEGTVIISNVVFTDDTTGVSFTSPWTEAEVHAVYFVPSPDGRSVYMLHPNHPPQKLTGDPATETFTFGAVTFTAPPAVWTGSNYPGAGTVFQGRLWLGGTPDEEQTFWASKSGLYENFTTGALADDGLEFTMSEYGQILWMMGTKNLLIGTENGEHIVTSDAGVITPGDIQVERQSSYGSARIQPRLVGDQVFYVSPDRTKLRAMQYEWTANNWLSRDLTFFSDHITAGRIRDLAWAQNPDNILYMSMDNGDAVGLSYERGENVWGWHRMTTDGDFKDFSAGPSEGISIVATVVQRNAGFISVETTLADHKHFMDSWYEKTSDVAFTIFDGLDHLEGKTIQIIVDGAVHPDKTVASGQVTLDYAGLTVYGGLKFTPRLVTLPQEGGAQTGSSVAHKKSYNKIVIDLLDSALPLINGKRPPSRTPGTPMDTVQPNTDGQISQAELGWSEDAIITIEQDLPLDCQILSIGGELSLEML